MTSITSKLLVTLHMLVVVFSVAISFADGIDGFLALSGRAIFLSMFLIATHLIGAMAYILKLHKRHEMGVFFYETIVLTIGLFFLSLDMSVLQGIIVFIVGWHVSSLRRRPR